MLEAEGLTPSLEEMSPGVRIQDHRHPFDEVRMVIGGSLLLNIAGNQMLLRPGDRVEIAANTKHSKEAQGSELCVCLVSPRIY